QQVSLSSLIPNQQGGWRYGAGYTFRLVNKYDSCPSTCQDDVKDSVQWQLRIVFPDGSEHAMLAEGYSTDGSFTNVTPDGKVYDSCGHFTTTTSTITYFSYDAAYLRLDVLHDSDTNPLNNPFTLYFGDGSKVVRDASSQRIYDRNGNFITVQ